jgi:hypothetical protein
MFRRVVWHKFIGVSDERATVFHAWFALLATFLRSTLNVTDLPICQNHELMPLYPNSL